MRSKHHLYGTRWGTPNSSTDRAVCKNASRSAESNVSPTWPRAVFNALAEPPPFHAGFGVCLPEREFIFSRSASRLRRCSCDSRAMIALALMTTGGARTDACGGGRISQSASQTRRQGKKETGGDELMKRGHDLVPLHAEQCRRQHAAFQACSRDCSMRAPSARQLMNAVAPREHQAIQFPAGSATAPDRPELLRNGSVLEESHGAYQHRILAQDVIAVSHSDVPAAADRLLGSRVFCSARGRVFARHPPRRKHMRD